MTTHSRERREHVARALSLPTYSLTHDECRYLANAAIQTLLPDRAAFDDALTELVACAMEWGVHEGEGRITADEQERLTNNAADVVRALVYDDDAQAGDQEGAEHE